MKNSFAAVSQILQIFYLVHRMMVGDDLLHASACRNILNTPPESTPVFSKESKAFLAGSSNKLLPYYGSFACWDDEEEAGPIASRAPGFSATMHPHAAISFVFLALQHSASSGESLSHHLSRQTPYQRVPGNNLLVWTLHSLSPG